MRNVPSPAEAISSPVVRGGSLVDLAERRVKHVPLGLNRTTFTAAECLLRVARYSTLDGRGAAGSAPALSSTEGGMILGCTAHNFGDVTSSVSDFEP